ncbi:MAG TPA: ABC transporter permease [Acidimicrobiales bacterium]|nr:ABC transporter permease [Acidimicrobiales bacterium]
MPEWTRERTWELLLAVILVGTVVYNASRSPVYLDVDNFVNLFRLSIEKVIVAVIMTFVIVNGEIDLSVASVMAFSACVLGAAYEAGVPFPLAIVLALVASAAAGFLQGQVIARTGISSLVVTLAGLIGFRGAARILLEDRSVGAFPEWFTDLGREDLLGPLPFALVLFLVFVVVAGVVLHRTAFGRGVFVIGDNADVARYSGIAVARTKVVLFTTSALVAGVAGVLFAARLGSVRANIAEGFELDIITMVLLGGVSIFGGSGTMLGVALAIGIVLNLRNGLGLANVEANTQTGVIGALLIVSVLVQNLLDRLPLRRREAEA